MYGRTILSNGTWENASNQGRLGYYTNNESRAKYQPIEYFHAYFGGMGGGAPEPAYWYTVIEQRWYWLASPQRGGFQPQGTEGNPPRPVPFAYPAISVSRGGGDPDSMAVVHYLGIAPAFCVK
jgi:hypothetical protein